MYLVRSIHLKEHSQSMLRRSLIQLLLNLLVQQ